MKTGAILFLCFILSNLYAQKSVDFSHIDWKVLSIEAAAPDTLAHWLTSPYKTDLEKTRAIFRWITENISYNAKGPYKGPFKPVKYLNYDPEDTSTLLKSLDERVAEIVLTRKLAVCDGYSRLFKTLCDYAGLKSKIITGYARTGNQKNFKSNHRWNAVMIDSVWQLLDVTWASGHFTYSSDEFIKRYNDQYFLPSPENFITDHYPEDLHWTLMKSPPSPREFNSSPLKYQAFQKFKINSYYPQKGLIEAFIGDTISFTISSTDASTGIFITDTLFNKIISDSLDVIQTKIIRAVKHETKGEYVITPLTPQWLYIVYNDEVILRYKVKIKKTEQLSIELVKPS